MLRAIKATLAGLLSATAVFGVTAKELNPKFQLLPLPQQIEVLADNALVWSDLTYIVGEGECAIPVLGPQIDRLPRTVKAGKGITLSLSTEPCVPQSQEGYVVEVSKQGITVKARSAAGLFYGCQTVEQLVEDSYEQRIAMPALKITDWPAIDYRAIHFDTKHHLDRTEYYYRVIDRLARYKINAVVWELEDKFRYQSHPEIAAANALSKQEMLAICRYAKERNIEISPLVQGLGHAAFILKHHWELREDLASDWEFCPSNPKTYLFQFDLYRDALEAMPYGNYLHVGGDEISAIGIDERCKATGKTPFELQMDWLGKVCDFATANGRTPIFWDDMPLKNGDLWWLLHGGLSDEEVDSLWNTAKLDASKHLFPTDCVYMRWHYDDPTTLPHRRVMEWYKSAGLKVMAATSASTGDCPFMPRNDSRALNIKNFSQLVVDNNLVGILSTVWDDGSPHWETVARGMIAQGEFGWNPSGRSVEEFKTAHSQREFGLSRQDVIFLDELEKAAFFFDGALVLEGSRNPAWGASPDFNLIDLPDMTNPKAWSAKYAGRLDSARIENERYQIIEKGIACAKANALRNRYTLDVYEQTSRLIHYPTRLLLALDACANSADSAALNHALADLDEVCRHFVSMREQLEAVYSQTRFMQTADGYVSDLNKHSHLASLTQNSDWLFLYEKPMVEAINSWLKDSATVR